MRRVRVAKTKHPTESQLCEILHMRLLPLLLIALLMLSSTASAVTLDFWHAWPDAAPAVQSLAARYTQQTGVSIRIHVMSPSARMSWGTSGGPDLAGLYRPTKIDIQSMAAKGLIQDLRAEMSRGWYAIFWPSLLDVFNAKGSSGAGIYGVPITGQVHVFVYNRQLFQKAGVGVPGTWSELMATSQKLRRIGVVPYAGGFGSDMPPLAAAYEYAYLGLHLLTETYSGHYPYTSSQWLAYLKLYSEMKRYGFTDAAHAKVSETDAIRALLDGRVAMVFVDQGFEKIRMSYKPTFTAWGAFGAPEDSRSRFLAKLPGGVVEGLVINSHSAHKAQAVAFARWLTEYSQQLALARGSLSIPAQTVASNTAQLAAPLRVFAAAGMRDMAIDLRIYEKPRVLAMFYSGVRGILAGSSTPSATARKTQRVKAH